VILASLFVVCLAVVIYFDQEDYALPATPEEKGLPVLPVQEETPLPMHDGQL
jgi:hypothetical protein